jgi:peptidoglycan/xylan/chitin deacetylase (PgdA/CDA1 family)
VKYFARNFDLISPSDLVAGTLPKKPLLITFDDVYRSVLEVGGPILREANVRSVWFMNPACLEAETLPLDNLLTLAVDHYGNAGLMRLLSMPGKPPGSVPALISDYISTLGYAQVAALKATISAGLPESLAEIRRSSGLFMNPADLKLMSDFGMQIGNHSLTHSFFRSLTPAELLIEIDRSREILERLSGQPVTCLAIPYGNELDATDAALSVARAGGHRAIFLVHGRCNSRRPAPDVFYRICADRLRPEYLPISISILPRLRTFRDRLR